MIAAKKACCPTCGRDLCGSVFGIIVDLGNNTVVTPLGGVKLTSKQVEIVYLLDKNSPAFSHTDRIYAGIWGNPERAHCDATIKVYISNLRRVLAPLGIEIECRTGCGYRLKTTWKEDRAE